MNYVFFKLGGLKEICGQSQGIALTDKQKNEEPEKWGQ
jgi:hypothetical protein